MTRAGFPGRAETALLDSQLRANLGHATRAISSKVAQVTAEHPDWQSLRSAGAAIKDRTLRHLPDYLEQLEANVQRAGGNVHWAHDAAQANTIVADLVTAAGAEEIVKVKSLTTEEIGLNEALARKGIRAVETDLAQLIVQLANDQPSHILVPAIHRNRAEIAALFRACIPGAETVSDDPRELVAVAREHLRRHFLEARVAVSGANFAVAESGAIALVESEGNGRMCVTLPPTLITVLGIEKLIPTWRDLEVFLQLLPRAATAERMNPYTTLWTGVEASDGPREFHLVLLDNGRSAALADPLGRTSLRCIRCSACLNVCPVYRRTGGHAYDSVYPGPIGAVFSPLTQGLERHSSLPDASSLCGACYEVCPVKIDIPRLLIRLRADVRRSSAPASRLERASMTALGRLFSSRLRYERAQRLGRLAHRRLEGADGSTRRIPGLLGAWTDVRDLPSLPDETFREWWSRRV